VNDRSDKNAMAQVQMLFLPEIMGNKQG
jgi:hypothetical protein